MFRQEYKYNTGWTVRDGFDLAILGNIFRRMDFYEKSPEFTVLKNNNVRTVFFLETGKETPRELFIKRYKCSGISDIVKYIFFPSKAVSEWKNLTRFEQLSLPCPRPLAFSEKKFFCILKDSCLVTEKLEDAMPLNEYVKNIQAEIRPVVVKYLAGLISRLHRKNVYFRDLHAGNIMIKTSGSGQLELCLVDLHRAVILPFLAQWMKVRDLAQLCNSLPATNTEKISFLRQYCQDRELFCIFKEKIYRKGLKLEARRIISRSKRCIKKSSVFENDVQWKQSYFGRKDLGMKQAIALVCMADSSSGRIVKESSKSVLSVHDTDKGKICVKKYKFKGFFYSIKNILRKSRAMKTWTAANGFIVRGIDTPLPEAIIEKKWGPFCVESYYFYRWEDRALELNDYIKHIKTREVKEKFLGVFAAVIRELHERRIYHSDLKSNNILVRESKGGGWKIFFVDLDSVLFRKRVDFYRRANNLAQINASVSDVITVKDRLRFFHLYAAGTSLMGERKKYYRKIIAISRTKITAPYGVTFS